MAGQSPKLSKFIANMKSLTGKKLEVGIIGHASDQVKGAEGLYEGGRLSLGELAIMHEFGTANMPPRSILQVPLESSEAQEIIARVITSDRFQNQLLYGDPTKALSILGKKLVNFLIKWFKTSGDGSWEYLSSEYETRKTRAGYPAEPLHTTMQLMEALEYKVK